MQRLELRSDLSELPRLSAFVRTVGRDGGLDSDRMFALELCLEEAVANIIVHGRSENATDKRISVMISNEAQTLVVRIEDDGPSFDPTVVETRAVPASLEEAEVGGLGVHLVRELTSDIRYERVENRNQLTLIFAVPANSHNS